MRRRWLVVRRWEMAERLVPLVKTVIEQFVYWSYVSNAYYHVVLGALQGLPVADCLHRLSVTFWPTMRAQWALWIPAQLVNFRYMPVRHQLNFVLAVSLVWTTFLSLAFPPEPARGAGSLVALSPPSPPATYVAPVHMHRVVAGINHSGMAHHAAAKHAPGHTTHARKPPSKPHGTAERAQGQAANARDAKV